MSVLTLSLTYTHTRAHTHTHSTQHSPVTLPVPSHTSFSPPWFREGVLNLKSMVRIQGISGLDGSGGGGGGISSLLVGLPDGSDHTESAYNVGHLGSIPYL